ncbi:MAG: TonB family protein [Gammaproteobacteria bacterium]|jgi:periplasmic protein TonB|nr:TonB family protein [Gammaproteobacteria bacterium]
MAALRIPVAFVLGLVVTATMFWFLARLIAVHDGPGDLVKAARIEFTRMRKDTPTESKREELKKAQRERTAQVPTAPRMSVTTSTQVSTAPVQIVAPKVDATSVKMNLSAGGSDRGVAPLVRVPPEYPRRALERGIEGWVHVRFTITTAGTVKDLVVVDSEPKGVFDEAATKAVMRWRYNPPVQNGVAVERVGEQTLVRFKLEN